MITFSNLQNYPSPVQPGAKTSTSTRLVQITCKYEVQSKRPDRPAIALTPRRSHYALCLTWQVECTLHAPAITFVPCAGNVIATPVHVHSTCKVPVFNLRALNCCFTLKLCVCFQKHKLTSHEKTRPGGQ